MIDSKMNAVIIKTAVIGLDPYKHLGKSIAELKEHFISINASYGCNICGEGGEYESLTIDCPIYKKKLEIKKTEIVIHSKDVFSMVGYLNFLDVDVIEK